MSGYFDGGQDLYAAIWRKEPNAPAWEGRHGLTSAQYQAFFNDVTSKGYKPVWFAAMATARRSFTP